jgi:ABC-type Fe3+/spermidine/putrescine transport system ATPase subunit
MIRVTRVSKRFADRAVLDNASFAAGEGEVTVILGPSGCGKTTLLRVIAGLESPDQGEIEIGGRRVSDPTRQIAPRKRGVGMIFQDLALWPHMRALDNVTFGLDRKKRGRRDLVLAQARSALARASIEHLAHRYPHELSGGERQRLAIARAVAPGHPCLLMDEPFNNLDPLLKVEMTALVRDLCASLGTTIIYVTHSLDEVVALADRVVVMNGGRVLGSFRCSDLPGRSREDMMSWYQRSLSP